MDFYLSKDGNRLRFPLTPDSITVKTNSLALSFQIIKLGEHKIPRGTSVTGYSWNGVLPDVSMSGLGFVFDWQPPDSIIDLLNTWIGQDAKLQFMVTETTINTDVFIESFTYTYVGTGRVNYSLSLATYRPLTITTAPAQPEVVIPTVAQPSTATAAVAADSGSGSSGGGASKSSKTSTKKNNTGKEKLSVSIPTSKIAGVASKFAAKQPVSADTAKASGTFSKLAQKVSSVTKDKIKK